MCCKHLILDIVENDRMMALEELTIFADDVRCSDRSDLTMRAHRSGVPLHRCAIHHQQRTMYRCELHDPASIEYASTATVIMARNSVADRVHQELKVGRRKLAMHQCVIPVLLPNAAASPFSSLGRLWWLAALLRAS